MVVDEHQEGWGGRGVVQMSSTWAIVGNTVLSDQTGKTTLAHVLQGHGNAGLTPIPSFLEQFSSLFYLIHLLIPLSSFLAAVS